VGMDNCSTVAVGLGLVLLWVWCPWVGAELRGVQWLGVLRVAVLERSGGYRLGGTQQAIRVPTQLEWWVRLGMAWRARWGVSVWPVRAVTRNGEMHSS
jgi:hypothetical protein